LRSSPGQCRDEQPSGLCFERAGNLELDGPVEGQQLCAGVRRAGLEPMASMLTTVPAVTASACDHRFFLLKATMSTGPRNRDPQRS
jgi:hypothetical protein